MIHQVLMVLLTLLFSNKDANRSIENLLTIAKLVKSKKSDLAKYKKSTLSD